MNTLILYETMSDISGRMAEAARNNDWERLVALEQDVAHMRDNLIVSEHRPPQLSPEERARKYQLISRILADDAEVRRHTQPWMEGAKKFLGAGVRERSLRQAYGL